MFEILEYNLNSIKIIESDNHEKIKQFLDTVKDSYKLIEFFNYEFDKVRYYVATVKRIKTI